MNASIPPATFRVFDGTVRAWSLAMKGGSWSQQHVLETKAHDGPVTSVAFLNDTCLASGGADRAIVLTRFTENTTLAGHTERRLQLTLRFRGMNGAFEQKLLKHLITESLS